MLKKFFLRQGKLMLFCALVVWAGTLIFSFQQKPTWRLNLSFTAVPLSEEEKSSYEALRSAHLFINSVRSWLHNEATLNQISQKSGVSLPQATELFSTPLLENSFSFSASASFSSKEEAEKVGKATIEVLKQKTQEFNQASQGRIRFELLASSPYIVEQKPNFARNLLLGLVAGILFGLFVGLSREYISS